MYQLESNGNTFGPFKSIEVAGDHYFCDGQVLPFTVVGSEGTITEVEPSAPVVVKNVPPEITMRQARLALLGAGKLALVDAAIASMVEPMKSAANIEWEYSNTVMRHNGFVSQLGPALGLSEAQVDDLFILAATL